jgi:hydroxymethylpyrimidine pyrophosphatase-like HAD family hydrolase
VKTSWIATDLDGTLIGRIRKINSLPATWKHQEDVGSTPSSWICPKTRALMGVLAAHFGIVPVTARDFSSFCRVAIPGLPFGEGAVLANGAILLKPDTMEPDAEHDARVEAILGSWAPILNDLIRQVHDLGQDQNVQARLVKSNLKLPAYLVFKASEVFWSGDPGQTVRNILQAAGLRTTCLGREVQGLPPGLSKRMGVEAFARRFHDGAPPLLGFGDHQEDLGFLELAEFMAIPRISFLAERFHDSAP